MLILQIADLAEQQWGLVTTAQARQSGVSRHAMARLAGDGLLERLSYGVYRVVGSAPSPLDELRAAWLALRPAEIPANRLGEPDAVVSYRSAAKYHQLGDLDADRFEFTIASRTQSRRPDVRFHREQLSSGDWQVVGGVPVTTIAKTIGDLARSRTDGGHLAGVVRDAITIATADVDEIVEALEPHARLYGAQPGDGRGVVARFLEEAGVPRAVQQAVALAPSAFADPR